jgi:hypothetical protein
LIISAFGLFYFQIFLLQKTAPASSLTFNFVFLPPDAMKFNGPGPERINGRLAMAMFALAAQNEATTGVTFYQQLTHPDPKLAVLALVLTYATMVPVLKGVKDEDFFMFTVKAEKWNGRLAMLGWVGLMYVEEFYAHASFF